MNDLSHLNWLRELPGKPLIVAEIKDYSPYGWRSGITPSRQLDICEAVGDIISVHTNELWGGSFDHLARVRARTNKPILAKGFHDTIHDVRRAFEAGADYCLTVGWHPGGEPRCWHEPETRNQLINSLAPWVVLNSRDPRTGERRTGFPDIAADRVVESVDRIGRKVCQASHIRSPQDVVYGVDAILIGEGLYTQP